MNKFRDLKVAVYVFLLALIVRLLVTSLYMEPIKTYDGDGYLTLAKQLIINGEIKQARYFARRAPLYPIVLAGWILICGDSNISLKIFNALICSFVCFFIFLIGKQIFGKPTAYMASLFSVFYPHLIYYSGTISTESLFIPLLSFTIFLLLRVSENSTKYFLYATGIVFGLTVLTRPVILMFVPFVLLWCFFVFKRQLAKTMTVSAIIIFGLVSAILPWTVRNYLRLGAFVPVTTMGGTVFWESNNPYILEDPVHWGRNIDADGSPEGNRIKGLPEVEKDRYYFKLGKEFLIINPSVVPKLLWHKFLRFWNPFIHSNNQLWNIVYLLSYGLILLFFPVGLYYSIHNKLEKASVLYSVIICINLSALIYWGGGRIRSPIEPYLILFSTFGISNIVLYLVEVYGNSSSDWFRHWSAKLGRS